MKDVAIDIPLDGAPEIIPPGRCTQADRGLVCACCGESGQPMDDGCGICDGCLGMPALATDNPDGLECSTPSHIYRLPPVIDDCLQR